LRRIGNLVWKDSRRRARNPVGVLVLVAIPLAISLIFGLVFSPRDGRKLPQLTLLVVDRDGSFVSRLVKSAFTQGELASMVKLEEVELAEGERLMEDGKASALLEIPEGFGKNLLDGKNVSLRLVKNPAEEFLPRIAQKVTETIALLLDYGVRILGGPLGEITAQAERKEFPGPEEWEGVGDLFYTSFEGISNYVFPPVIALEVEEEKEEEGGRPINFFGLFLPGMALMSLLFLASTAFRDLAVETSGGQLARIVSSPTPAWAILVAKFVSSWVLVYVSYLIMTFCGVLLFRLELERPLGFFAGGALVSAAVTGIMSLVYSFMSEERRGEAITSIIVILMCMIGGSFIPYAGLPAFLKGTAHFTVNYWSIDLLAGSINPALAEGDLFQDVVVLSGITLVSVAIAFTVLRRRMTRGILS
jgi:ABC-type multidrug transport system permease subunit